MYGKYKFLDSVDIIYYIGLQNAIYLLWEE